MDADARRLELALEIGREAAMVAKHLFTQRTAGTYKLKGPQDYITEADAAVEALLKERIASAFPDDTVFGEEGGGSFGDHAWVLDPIDGTANFARGIPHFSISIAYVNKGAPAVGVIVDPIQGEIFAARRGAGARLNDRPMSVSGASDMRAALVEIGWSFRLPIRRYVEVLDRVTALGAGVNRAGSGALGLAYVAAGRLDGYAELHINAWDCLAGIVLVREAGGWCNDFLAGNGLRVGNPILGCAPGIATQLQEATGIRA